MVAPRRLFWLLKSAGIRRQKAYRNYARIIRPISIEDGDKWIKATPYNGFKVNYTIDFGSPGYWGAKYELGNYP